MIHADEKPLIDVPEAQLKDWARLTAKSHAWGYDDIVRELDRRASNRQARYARLLSIVAVVIALAALIVTALKP